jgi:hypothetical protein
MKGLAGGALGALLVCAALAAPAQATIRQGAGSDPAGDSTGGAGTDITAIAGKSDDTGSAAVAVQTSSASWPGVWVAGVLGTRRGDSCDGAVVFLGDPSSRIAVYSFGSGSVDGQLNIDGPTITMFASGPSFARALDCAVGYTLPAGSDNLNAAYDRTSPAWFAADAPPAATPTATPAPAAPIPAPTVANTPPVPVAKTAKLTLSFGGAPATIKRNKPMTLTLKIANDGSKKSSAVRVSFGKPRGLSGVSRKPKKLSALKPAQQRTLRLKVKLTKAARKSTTLKVTVKAGKLKATSAVVLRIGKAKRPQPEAGKSPIVGTFWWRTVNHVDYAWDNRALYFADGGAVYSGFPKGGLPAGCTTPVAEPGDEIDTREGCLPYTFDEKSGAVTIGDKAGTFKDGKLTIDGNEYTPLFIPPAGKRYQFNEHRHASFQGLCGLITGCTTTQEYLTLTPDGQFVLTRSTLSTIGDPGSGPYTAAGSWPPDQHGTYDVQAGGKIVLTFANGTVRTETFAEDTKDGRPSPTGEGVFVGEDNYYPDPFPDR